MKSSGSADVPTGGSRSAWLWLVALATLAVALALLPRLRQREAATNPTAADADKVPAQVNDDHSRASRPARPRAHASPVPGQPAEEVVAAKVSQFARQHEVLVDRLAAHFKVAVPEEINRLFAALQAGRWEEATNLLASLKELRQGENWPGGLERLWPAIMETYGVAEAAHNWPAQQLLDYGHAILGSLRPGMVYVGGTDAGRFIPTLLTETGEGQPHIVLTQNALADMTYLDYLNFRYGDRLGTLTSKESETSFQAYIADAQKRLQQDQSTPDGPRQIRPGEDVRVTEGRVQVSGQVAVMSINEILLQTLMRKNPEFAFALEESFPLKSFYAGANVLGPIMELRADASSPLTADSAAQALDYWRSTTQSLQADPATTSASRDAYTKLMLGQANLFLNRELPAQAEQAYQMANQLNPANPEGVFSYVNLLCGQGRMSEARQLVQNAVNLAPANDQFRALLGQFNSP